MKKKLRISLGLTVFMMLLMWISDLLFHTKFMGAAVFQPFPHLIFSCYWDLIYTFGINCARKSESNFLNTGKRI